MTTLSEVKDQVTAAADLNTCGICRVNRLPPPCPGHILPDECGSDDGDDNLSTADSNSIFDYMTDINTTKGNSVQAQDSKASMEQEWQLLLQLQTGTIEYDYGLVSVVCERLFGNLILKPRPPLSREELELIKQYLELINLEFSEFKRKLMDEGIPARSFVSAIKTHELMVTIPNPRFFNEFMMVLAKKNLLPHPTIAEQKKLQKRIKAVALPQQEIKEEQHFHPSPFDSMRKGPRPKGYKKTEEA